MSQATWWVPLNYIQYNNIRTATKIYWFQYVRTFQAHPGKTNPSQPRRRSFRPKTSHISHVFASKGQLMVASDLHLLPLEWEGMAMMGTRHHYGEGCTGREQTMRLASLNDHY